MNQYNQDTPQNDFTLRDFYYIVFRHFRKIALFFLIVNIVAVVLFIYTPETYISEASLIVSAGRENVEMIPTVDKTVTVSRTNSINTEVEILHNGENFKEIVRRIGIDTFITKHDKVNMVQDGNRDIITEYIALNLQNNLSIKTQRGSDIINIYYQSLNPSLAQQVVSTLIDVYLDKRAKVHYSDSEYNFFKEQVEETRISLYAIEDEIKNLNTRLITGNATDNSANLLSRIESLQQERDSNRSSIAECQSQITYLRQELRNNTPQDDESGAGGGADVQGEVGALQIRKQELLTRYTEDNAQIKEINRQLEELKKLQRSENPDVQNMALYYQQVQEQLATQRSLLVSLQARDRVLSDKLNELKNEVSNFNDLSLQIQKLERERDNLNETYKKYSDNFEEAKIDQIVQQQKISNVKILQPATFPTSPLASRKYRNLFMGIFVGLFGGIGIAFASEFLDHSIKRQDEVDKWLDLRPLVSIPYKKDIGNIKLKNS